MPHEITVPPLPGGEVARQDTGLVVDAVSYAVGLICEVDVLEEVVGIGVGTDSADHPGRDHVGGMVHVEKTRAGGFLRVAPVPRHSKNDIATLALEELHYLHALGGCERAGRVVE